MSEIAELAAKCLQNAKGDDAISRVRAATDALYRRVMRNRTLYRALMDPLVRDACYMQVSKLARSDRRIVWNNLPVSKSEDRRRITALSDGYTLRDFTLQGGKRLCEATGDEIAEAAAKYRAQGTTELHVARWLEMVRAELPSGTARCTLSAARLKQLKAIAESEINRRLDGPPQAIAAQ